LTELHSLTLLAAIDQIDPYFGDKSSFNQRPCVPYGWLSKGKQTDITTDRQLVSNVFGLLNLKSNHLKSYVNNKNIDSKYMIRCLDDFANDLDNLTVVVLDQASYHRSKLFNEQIDRWQEKNLYIFLLPPYSPQLNPIEILWRFIKYYWLKPKDYLSKHSLSDAIMDILENYGGKYKINWEQKIKLPA